MSDTPLNAPSGAARSAAALLANRWPRGKSGNPGGKGGRFKEVQAMARGNSPAAMRTLIDLMSDADPKIAGWAADKVLCRAWGNPKDYDPKAEPDDNRPRFDPSKLSPEQLDLVEAALRLMVRATAPPEVEVYEVDETDESEVIEGGDRVAPF